MNTTRKGSLVLETEPAPEAKQTLVDVLLRIYPKFNRDQISAFMSRPKPLVLIKDIEESRARTFVEALKNRGVDLRFFPSIPEGEVVNTAVPPAPSEDPGPQISQGGKPSHTAPSAAATAAPRRGRMRIAFLFLAILLALGFAIKSHVFNKSLYLVHVAKDKLKTEAANLLGSEEDEKPASDVEKYGYPETPERYEEISDAFWSRDFARLNEILDSFQRSIVEDFHYEYAVHNSYSFFNDHDPSREPVFVEWLNAEPETYVPHLAMGVYCLARAWDARGEELASETTDEQFARMGEFIQKAEESLLRALELEPRAFRVYTTMIFVKQLNGGISANIPVVQKALSLYPESFLIRQFFLQTSIPRWGGSYEQMELFARESQKYLDQNPKLKLLYGFSYYDRGQMDQINGLVDEAIKNYSKALTYGEFSTWLTARARCYINKQMYPDALKDLDRSIARASGSKSARIMRSGIREQMKDYEGAADDLIVAYSKEPVGDKVDSFREKIADKLCAKAFSISDTDLSKAMSLMDKSLKVNPTSIPLNVRREILLLKCGQDEKAYEELTSFITSREKDLHTEQAVARELVKAGFSKPGGFWDFYCNSEPDDPGGFLLRGQEAIRSGDNEKGMDDLAKAGFLAPDNKDVYETIYKQLRNSLKSESSLKFWSELAEKAPESGLALYYLGVSRTESGDSQGAASDFKKACDLGLDWGCSRYQYMMTGKPPAQDTGSTISGKVIPFSRYKTARYYLECGNRNRVLAILGDVKPEERDDSYYTINWRAKYDEAFFRETAIKSLREGMERFPSSLLLQADWADYLYREGKIEEFINLAATVQKKLGSVDDHRAAERMTRVYETYYEDRGQYHEIQDLYSLLIGKYGKNEDIVRSMRIDALVGDFNDCGLKFQMLIAREFLRDETAGALSQMALAAYFNNDEESGRKLLDKLVELDTLGKYGQDAAYASFLLDHQARKISIMFGNSGRSWTFRENILANALAARYAGRDDIFKSNLTLWEKEYAPSEKFLLALVLAQLNHKEALAVSEKVIHEFPGHPLANYAYGLVLKEKGDAGAQKYFGAAADTLPNQRFLQLAGAKRF